MAVAAMGAKNRRPLRLELASDSTGNNANQTSNEYMKPAQVGVAADSRLVAPHLNTIVVTICHIDPTRLVDGNVVREQERTVLDARRADDEDP